MNTKQKLHQLHLNEWTSRFADQKASGLTVSKWCEQNSFSIHSYNYWKHILKEELASQILPDIVPLVVPEEKGFSKSTVPVTPHIAESLEASLTNRANRATPVTTATLTINGISIQVNSDISEDFLRTVIKAVHYA